VARAIVAIVIMVRVAWHMSFNAVVRWRHRRSGFNPRRSMLRPTVGSGVVISWAGMRGIVSLAGALTLPPNFPYRGLIVLTAFSVVLGTLIIHGLTLKPLLRVLELNDDDPVGREVRVARERALRAGLETFADEDSPVARAVREELTTHLPHERVAPDGHSEHEEFHRRALDAARQEVLTMRANQEIGDDAFHQLEEELDWLEMAGRHPSSCQDSGGRGVERGARPRWIRRRIGLGAGAADFSRRRTATCFSLRSSSPRHLPPTWTVTPRGSWRTRRCRGESKH
jgi:CPA1 family monovalent cation:H+ antiporter